MVPNTTVRAGARIVIAATLWAAFIATLFVLVVPAYAADAEAGKRLTGQWCISCHSPGPTSRTSDTAAPSFTVIVNRRKRTEGQLRVWLSNPHPPMTKLSLSRGEIDDIIAYLEGLRTR